jgi:hypothetical protein
MDPTLVCTDYLVFPNRLRDYNNSRQQRDSSTTAASRCAVRLSAIANSVFLLQHTTTKGA